MRKAWTLVAALSFAAVPLAAPTPASADDSSESCGPGCAPGRSSASKEVLTIRWEPRTRVSPETPPGGSRTAPAPRPMWVWVASDDTGDPSKLVERLVLADVRLSIGSRAFDCLTLSVEDAAKDPLLAEHGTGPRFLFVARTWDDVAVVEGSKRTISGVWSAMRARAKKDYEGDFAERVRATQDLLAEWDTLAEERKTLAEELEETAEPGPEALEARKAKAAELDARQAAADARAKELLTWRPRELGAP